MKKTHVLTILLTLTLAVSAIAQKSPCRIVTSNLDTLFGTFIEADSKLIFTQSYNRQRIALRPEEVLEYALLQADGTEVVYQFILHAASGKRVPMHRLVDGYYKLYLHKEPKTSSVNPALPKNSPVPHMTSVYYLASYSEDAVKVSPRNWERVLQKRLADCPLLLEDIADKNFQFKHLPAVVATYNALMRQEIAIGKRQMSLYWRNNKLKTLHFMHKQAFVHKIF